jgi:nucleotide-binding universal stress UspA family protein
VRILCPSDGSPRAAAAIDKVISSFSGDGHAVELLVVVPPRRHGTDRGPGAAGPLDEYLAGEQERLEAAGFVVEVSSREGHPVAEIIACAETRPPDLIVVGARSPEGNGTGYSGRVAGNVARHSHVPVLIAKDGGPVGSIVLGYDESPDADAALELVARLPYCRTPRVAVCSAFEVGDTLLPGVESGEDLARTAPLEDLVESRHAAEAIAAEAAARLRAAGLSATGQAMHGRASRQLEILAAELGADLIVVGSRGLSGVQRFLLGSTSDELVVTARISVLVVRS